LRKEIESLKADKDELKKTLIETAAAKREKEKEARLFF